jgi:FHS family Na+ dependent glucose MFS transporter 1
MPFVRISEGPASAATRRLTSTLAYYGAFTGLGMVAAILGPTLPGLAQQTHASLSAISSLFTARSLGYLLGSLKIGRWFDLLPGHTLMAALIACMAATLALVPFIPTLWILIGLMLLMGVAEASVDVGGNTLLMRVHQQGVGPFMNGLHFFFGLGAFLAPVILAQVIWLSGSIAWAYWGIALLNLPLAAFLARLPSPPVGSEAAERRAGITRPRLVLLVALFFFLYVGSEVSFGGWIYTYTLAALDLDGGTAAAVRAAYLTSAFWGALTVGRLLAIPISTKFKPATMLFADLMGALASVGLILLFSGAGPALLTGTIWAGALGAGLFMASVFPTILSLVSSRMPVNGQVTGWFFVGSGAGAMSLPWLIGQLFERISPRATMWTILAALLLALFVFVLILAVTRPKSPGAAPDLG